jgi:hypothetical protein
MYNSLLQYPYFAAIAEHLELLLTSILSFPSLAEYPILMGLLRHRTHKELASKIIHAIVDSGTRIRSEEKVTMLFRYLLQKRLFLKS